MATRKQQQLTEEQNKRNALILARLEAERRDLVEETRALQRQYRRKIRHNQVHKRNGAEFEREL
jgi:hypothetical protein